MVRWILLLLLILAAGCNLSTSPPTPTLPPTAIPAQGPLPTFAGIVEADPNATPINPTCPATPPTWIAYTVEPGDTLSLLAEQTGSTIVELMTNNCLESADDIYVGQPLFLPSVPIVAP